ncbi:MAG: F0F1 ATP synthase subunit B [Gemmatimonadetes bacterium]|nr:F0F1 ATP synthase subunit B [Gemmatimonadota bacterium]
MRTLRPACLAGIALLVAAGAVLGQEHGAEGGGGGGLFSVNVGLIVWTWVLFLITLGILVWKVFPAISGGLEARHAKIQGAIDDARKAREDAEAMRAEHEAALAQARAESKEIIENARGAADGLKRDMLDEAKAQQTAILEDAKREIQGEREQLREEIRREAVDIALAASERLMRTRLDADENRRLVGEFVSEI